MVNVQSPKKRILVIDDNPDVVEIIVACLSGEGSGCSARRRAMRA